MSKQYPSIGRLAEIGNVSYWCKSNDPVSQQVARLARRALRKYPNSDIDDLIRQLESSLEKAWVEVRSDYSVIAPGNESRPTDEDVCYNRPDNVDLLLDLEEVRK